MTPRLGAPSGMKSQMTVPAPELSVEGINKTDQCSSFSVAATFPRSAQQLQKRLQICMHATLSGTYTCNG